MENRKAYVIILPMIVVSSGLCQSVTRTLPFEIFHYELVCGDEYGTILGHLFKLQDISQCAARCAADASCNSAVYDPRINHCVMNTDYFENRTIVGCPDHIVYLTTDNDPSLNNSAAGCNMPVNTSNVEYPVPAESFSPVGTEIPYICHPCTFFPPLHSSSMVTCLSDGYWSEPVCLYGPDEGYTFNGTPIPSNAIGCGLNFNGSCPAGNTGDFTYDGQVGTCYCDTKCCNNLDCCFDSTCEDDYILDYYYYYP